MESVSPIADGLAKNPLAWGLALALVALVYLYKQLSVCRENHAKEIGDLQAKLVDQLRADAKEQREILSQVLPLSAKLTEGLEIVSRLAEVLHAKI